ncbi:RNase HII [Panacagrimonas perspica]|uniref:Ribonuclease HII n=1 Tax=Panacagrimonas perspica TaxID=381431 RepID=A0A4R7P9X3_9GAMM|nr:ribonuclease HII [Panacagrimonas perspica]TDU30678.1 RNase HII [Panacagrimonas perspica]
MSDLLSALPPRAPTRRVAGVDEVGRGCLAGPVYAAAVVLPPRCRIKDLDDSKKLSAERRQAVALRVREKAMAWSIGRAEVEEIDGINILQATFLAMRRALEQLSVQPTECWVDGNQDPRLGLPVRLIVGGDGLEACIMAASVIAKVARDEEMARLCEIHPGYGFAKHKGYGTPLHLDALRRLGPSAIHRRSFAPCAASQLAFSIALTPDSVPSLDELPVGADLEMDLQVDLQDDRDVRLEPQA